jgi:hypothetical protein
MFKEDFKYIANYLGKELFDRKPYGVFFSLNWLHSIEVEIQIWKNQTEVIIMKNGVCYYRFIHSFKDFMNYV